MATKKSMWVLFGILVISAWVLGSAIQAGAETMNYKFYSYVIKVENVPVGDVEGHTMGVNVRSVFLVFENGEVATGYAVATGDSTKGTGSFSQYVNIIFADGSTILIKDQGTVGEEQAPGHIQRADGQVKSLKGQADLKESRGLKLLKPSIFRSKNGKLDQKELVKELIPIPSLPNDF